MTMKDNNPLKGLGTDIIELERVRQSLERHGQHFLNRIFTQKEQDYCYRFKDPIPHIAGRFAAKEAIAKALGTGIGANLSWHDMEILGDTLGKPEVTLSADAQYRFHNPTVLLSISHCTTHATATAIFF